MTNGHDGQSIDGCDVDALSAWMDDRNLGDGPITNVIELTGGTQNILVQFERAGRSFVLRRPPVHKRKNSDETMRREACVLGAIADTDVAHPALIAAEDGVDVLGAAFYLMEPIKGFNPGMGLPDLHRNSAEIQRAMGVALVDGASALGAVDYLAVGLVGFGRPDGYLERQVARWRSQLDGYGEVSSEWRPDIPGVDAVGDWLEANRPTHFEPGIIHGDYHTSNVMYRYDSADLAAVVDWELATVGDPLLDLGLIVGFGTPDPDGAGGVAPNEQLLEAFPPADELIARYGERSTRDVSAANWYGVLACYKTGIILEGTNARAMAGKASREFGDLLHAVTLSLFRRAHVLMAAS